jgi:hypothetical protein
MDFHSAILPIYAFFLVMWGVFMLEFWKRKEKFLAMKWGTVDYMLNEISRPGNL